MSNPVHHVSRRRLLALTGGAATAAAVGRPAQLLAQRAPATVAFAGTPTLQWPGRLLHLPQRSSRCCSARWRRAVPGAIVYVNDPDQGAWTVALGIGNLATGEPMQVTDLRAHWQPDQAFTATAILQLVDQGLMQLDDPVSTYQPAVPNGDNITIRQLLNMTSGLATYDDDEDWVQAYLANPTGCGAPEELVAVALKHPPDFAPGEGWHYSNTNTILLGMIVEQLTQQLVGGRVPALHLPAPGHGPDQSAAGPSSAIPDPHAQGYMFGTEFTERARSSMSLTGIPRGGGRGGGDLDAARSRDLAKALATGELAQRGNPGGAAELGGYRPPLVGEALGYGLGVIDFAGFVGHSGVMFGYTSWMGHQPETGATIIVLTNLFLAEGSSPPA